eukprot:8379927-Pyramimonas_sp.AAC.1
MQEAQVCAAGAGWAYGQVLLGAHPGGPGANGAEPVQIGGARLPRLRATRGRLPRCGRRSG